jgi:hypothetical protein
MTHRLLLALSASLASVLATPPEAAQLPCPDDRVSVDSPDSASAALVCEQIEEIRPALAECGLEQAAPLTIHLVDHAGDSPFIGSYAAGSNEIRLTHPDRLPEVLSPDHPFARLEPSLLFQSLLVHELSHAFLDQAECTRTRCVAEHEYVAYAMQLWLLPEDARMAVIGSPETQGMDPVAQESLNDFAALLDPLLFASRVWQHFSQPENGCDFIRRIESGEVDLSLPPL